MGNPSPIAIYLADHCAGATAGVALARRVAVANATGPHAVALARVAAEIEQDRATLERLVGELGLRPSRLKNAAAWLTERLGRLKPNGRVRGSGGYDRLHELEALSLGIAGKLALWEALGSCPVAAASSLDLAALAERARSQRDQVEEARLAVAAALLRPPSSSR